MFMVSAALLCEHGLVRAEDRFEEVRVAATALTDHVYMLTGAGGNIAATGRFSSTTSTRP
jgi:hypothetical protein